MLRITIHDNQQPLIFQLEGRLAGAWVEEVKRCWRSTLAHHRNAILHVDLTGVTFIDEAGTACLAAMHRQGAELVAGDCLTRDIVAEITRSSLLRGRRTHDDHLTPREWELNHEGDSQQE